MEVTVIVIGDELLIGQVVDTNSGMIARTLAPYGWTVRSVMVVPDSPSDLLEAIDRAFAQTSVVLTTGGLGPTKDDLTKAALTSYFGGSLRQDPTVLDNVRRIFAAKGLPMNNLTASQAMVPTSCRVIQNTVGTAPILWFEKNSGRNVLVAMPGVPLETSAMFPSAVLPALLNRFPSTRSVEHRTLLLYGISESDLATSLSDFEDSLPPSLHLAYLPADGMIRLRLDCSGTSRQEVSASISSTFARLKQLTAKWMVAECDSTPEQILLSLLQERHLMFASAESCTGGNIAHRLTLIPGSSEVILGGVVSYSNSVKVGLLGVDSSDINLYGAVSIPVAEQMARGACRACGADIAVATSGIAGPSGAVPGKPVGTVCIAVSILNLPPISHTFHFSGSRPQVIERASTAAIMMAINAIKNL